MELIRGLLLFVEKKTDNNSYIKEPDPTEDYDEEMIDYHLNLLYKAGFVEAEPVGGGTRWLIKGLTWEGHDFIDDARNEEVWQKAKERAGNTLSTISMEALKALLHATARSILGV